jgi:ribosomal protein S18 acetylase RimI-like enzyme
MTGIELRAPGRADIDAIWRVEGAQDTAWWGAPDSERDDVVHWLDVVEQACGSLEAGARVAVVDGEVVGMGALMGHGQTGVAVDPGGPHADDVREALFDWLVDAGATQFEAPAQDSVRLAQLAHLGFPPVRSSFELERSAEVGDIDPPTWPDDCLVVPYRHGVDDAEVHSMIYSFWTDVAGHTYRPLDEWQRLILGGHWFDERLVVLVRSRDTAAVVAVGLCRFFGDVGWVTQLGVGRDARGRGLGRAVLAESCHRLAAAGARIVGLGVEAENRGALGLYLSLGFEVSREWVHCCRD